MSPGSRPTQGIRPASASTTPMTAMNRPKKMRSLPTSFMAAASASPARCMDGLVRTSAAPPCPRSFEQSRLPARRRRRLLAEVQVRVASDPPAGGRADQEGDLQQVGLHELDERLGLVVDGGGDGFHADP